MDNIAQNPTDGTPAPHDPAPGREYKYVLSDYARDTARVLGPDWGSESGFLGATGQIFTLDGSLSLVLCMDGEDDLTLRQTSGPDYSVEHTVPTWESAYAPPTDEAELRHWAELIADTIRDAYNL
ncbi:hypothetical protein [Streptomyces scopuliridis]|uniref:hypothetical protein n=1 Tax=Streptomyces scopuliridis TaxID=452529 RepID=UPI00368141CC